MSFSFSRSLKLISYKNFHCAPYPMTLLNFTQFCYLDVYESQTFGIVAIHIFQLLLSTIALIGQSVTALWLYSLSNFHFTTKFLLLHDSLANFVFTLRFAWSSGSQFFDFSTCENWLHTFSLEFCQFVTSVTSLSFLGKNFQILIDVHIWHMY